MILRVETKVIKRVSVTLVLENNIKNEYLMNIGDTVTIKFIDKGVALTATGTLKDINNRTRGIDSMCILVLDCSTVFNALIYNIPSDNIREITLDPIDIINE